MQNPHSGERKIRANRLRRTGLEIQKNKWVGVSKKKIWTPPPVNERATGEDWSACKGRQKR
jgi:hypothetical protein